MLFRTDPRDQTKNNTSSYLDLSILYGTNQKEQDAVRDKYQGRGLLYPAAFSEERLIFVPPASTALLVLFSRNHNVCHFQQSFISFDGLNGTILVVYRRDALEAQRAWQLV